jgi:hypothetical protein
VARPSPRRHDCPPFRARFAQRASKLQSRQAARRAKCLKENSGTFATVQHFVASSRLCAATIAANVVEANWQKFADVANGGRMNEQAVSTRNRAALGDVIGTPELAAWQTAPGCTWIQTRSPEYARKLSRRADCRLVAVGVAGGFMRTFCARHSLRWARGLIARYTRRQVCANDVKTAPASPAAGDCAEVRRT